ncbi:MAG: PIN domain-containing protein [Candidatus Sulfotelmatobacter sp.]
MRTALDTNIVAPIWLGVPAAGEIAAVLAKLRGEGALVISAPVFVELSAVPGLTAQMVRKALAELSISIDFDMGEEVWQLAATTFSDYAIRRRRSGGGLAKRFPADFIIAAHAQLKADRLMTRDARRYSLDFPNLRLL